MTTPHTPIALIAAVARNRCIGNNNQLVWRHPADLRHFRQQTLGCPVIMGRKTWDSLPPKFRPLPGRRNIVVTRQPHWQAEGATAAHSLDQALALAHEAAAHSQPPAPRVIVIGGAQLYAQALPLADELILTEVDAEFDGDAFFPLWNRADFTAVASAPAPLADGEAPHDPAFRFVTYRRR